MVICPKCNLSNDEEYLFCVECGTPLTKIPDPSPKDPTLLIPSGELLDTIIMTPDKTAQTPSDELLKT